MDTHGRRKTDNAMNSDETDSSTSQVERFLTNLRSRVAQLKSSDKEVESPALQKKEQLLPSADYPGQANSSNKESALFDFSESQILGISEAQGEEYSAVLGKIAGQILPIELSTANSVLYNVMSATDRLVNESDYEPFTSWNTRVNPVLLGSNLHRLGKEDLFESPSRELGPDMLKFMSLDADQEKVIQAARKSLGGMTFVQAQSGSDSTNLIKQVVVPFLLCQKSQQQVVICCATDATADTLTKEVDAMMTEKIKDHPYVSRQYVVRLYLEAPARQSPLMQDSNDGQPQSRDFGIHGSKLFQEVLRNASVIISTTAGIAANRTIGAIEPSTTSLIFAGNTGEAELFYVPIFAARFKQDPKLLIIGDLYEPAPQPLGGPATNVFARQTQLTFMKRMIAVGHNCNILGDQQRSNLTESDDPNASIDEAPKTVQAKPAQAK